MATILVVDDQPTNRDYLVTLLRYVPHEVLEAGDGVQALDAMRDRRPDLVITDVRMATVDGYELVRRMRADAALSAIPVIFYTAGSYERETRELAESCGVQHILIKPSDPQVILQVVNTVLGIESPSRVSDCIKEFDSHLQDLPKDSIDPDAIVSIVDDDAATRRALTDSMEAASLKVKSYISADRFLDGCDFEKSGCLLVDIRMPGMSGVELLEALRSRGIEMPAIVLTGHGNIPAAVTSLKLGVLDFLEKPANPRILLAKVFQALQMDGLRRRTRQAVDLIRKRIATLSPRELTMLKLVVSGRSNKEIAQDLTLSCKTIANHRMNLMRKTHALNAADLARMSGIAAN